VPRRLRRNPSLRPRLEALLVDAYADARKEAAAEVVTKPDRFPAESPFTLAEALDAAFWPERG
jgi:hypothetical protein